MSSSFSGISAARSAMQAQRAAMDVVGANIANVATTGYTRQRVELSAAATNQTSAMTSGGTEQGATGVTVTGISRLASDFWTSQVNTQTSLHADLAQRADTLSQLEDTTGEPSDDALSTGLSTMWKDWSNLVSNPVSDAAKTTLVNDSKAVATTLATNYAAVNQQWTDLRSQTSNLVTEVNTQASTVASLNAQIRAVSSSGGNANTLMDQRDTAITRLSELTGATSVTQSNGNVNVFVGNYTLVDNDNATAVSLSGPGTMAVPSSPTTALTGASLTTFSIGGHAASVPGGQISASLDGLNSTIPGAAAQYNAIAAQVASAVNGAISTAYGAASAAATAQGITLPTASTTPAIPTFFGTTDASATVTATNLTVKATVATLSAAVTGTYTSGGGAATVNGGADTAVASAVAALSTATSASASPSVAWKTYVADLGARSSTATAQATSAASTLASAVSNQTSESGVDMDEETSNLLVIQRAYQGAARVLTAVDQMLDTLINSTGEVGR